MCLVWEYFMIHFWSANCYILCFYRIYFYVVLGYVYSYQLKSACSFDFVYLTIAYSVFVLNYLSTALINYWLAVIVRRWRRYWTIPVSTHSYTCQFSRVQTAFWWIWKENTAKPTSDMWWTSCDKGFAALLSVCVVCCYVFSVCVTSVICVCLMYRQWLATVTLSLIKTVDINGQTHWLCCCYWY